MTNPFFLSFAESVAPSLGFSPEAFLVLFVLAYSISFSLALVFVTDKKELGLPTFLFWLVFFAVLDVISWLVVAIPLILSGAFYYQKKTKG